MQDETLVEPISVQEFFVDGFADHRIENGMFSVAAYRLHPSSELHGEPQKLVIARFVMRVSDASEMQKRTRAALQSALGITEDAPPLARYLS